MDVTLTFLDLFAWSLYFVSPLLLLLSLIIIILGQVVTYLEKWNKFDGLYWSFITATTVGYGDIRPSKKISRVLSIFIAIIGIMFTGIILAAAVKTMSVAIEKHLDPYVIEQIQKDIDVKPEE